MSEFNIGKQTLNIPFGELIHSVARGIADAQFSMDKASMTVAEFMSGQRMVRNLDTGELLDEYDQALPDGHAPRIIDSRVFFGYRYEEKKDGSLVRKANKLSMMELGFIPNFYHFVDTVIELKLAISVHGTEESRVKSNAANYPDYRQFAVTAATVDANYAAAYQYDINLACTVKTKLVPVPAPALFEERVREQMRHEAAAEGRTIEERPVIDSGASGSTDPTDS